MNLLECKIIKSEYKINKSTSGYVYLICDPENNAFKIGVTRSKINRRLKKLQTGNPTKLHIVAIYNTNYPFRLESMLHNLYKQNCILNEWFKIDSISKWINDCKTQEKIIYDLLDNPFFSYGLK